MTGFGQGMSAAQVAAAISAAVSGLQDASQVSSAIASAISGLQDASQVSSAIASAIAGLQNASEVNALIAGALASYTTTAGMSSAISTAISDLAAVQKANAFAGLTPTLAGFSTNPNNLNNALDNDLATATGFGVRNVSNDYIGTITYDLGSTKTVLLYYKYGWKVATTAGDAKHFLFFSTDNTNYYSQGGPYGAVSTTWLTTTEEIAFGFGCGAGRYIRLAPYATSSGQNHSYRLFEIHGVVLR